MTSNKKCVMHRQNKQTNKPTHDDVITSDISNDVADITNDVTDISNDICNDVTDISDVTKDVPKIIPSDISSDRGKRPLPDAESDSTVHQVPCPKRLKELCPILKKSENFGICEYVSKAHDGFYGVLKHRCDPLVQVSPSCPVRKWETPAMVLHSTNLYI
jgi:hypothetical protein